MKKEKLMKIQERLVFLLIFLFLLPIGVIAQQKMITGQVVDEQGEAVIGASVMVKGAKTGTITDLDGNFSVQGKAGQTLSISYVGYTPLDVKITKLQNNRFVLKENTEVLDEVVVVGMDTQKRNTITAAVSVVKGDDIVNRPITDLTSALQGNVAGLNFASDAMGGAKGGELGTDIKFNIRGVGSINGGEPYVLVDGIEQSMQNVNPADVASISVLKDASAAAIYGARAAYGVVLVTTKSGNSEKAKVSYSGTVGFSSPIRTPQMMNSLEFAYYNNALYDAGASASGINRISDSVIEKIKGFMQNPYSEEFPGIDVSSNGEDWASAYYAQYGNTDWFKYYYKDKSIRHSHNLSVQGGSQKINYYIGMGYVYQEGFLDHVKDDLSKYNLNTKLQAKPTDWLRFNLNKDR
ncbi:SusC/RagA family TonB-linked outer membrane protein, partial [Bacteroides sp. 1001302B_160321_D4]|uniref:SusC/RagA family TonB-linked outer membrane protein n=1 Tax=Bacteroides sp. 1001302B_160321_D4 TaxID=2789205 RepID=UPI001B3C6C8A